MPGWEVFYMFNAHCKPPQTHSLAAEAVQENCYKLKTSLSDKWNHFCLRSLKTIFNSNNYWTLINSDLKSDANYSFKVIIVACLFLSRVFNWLLPSSTSQEPQVYNNCLVWSQPVGLMVLALWLSRWMQPGWLHIRQFNHVRVKGWELSPS